MMYAKMYSRFDLCERGYWTLWMYPVARIRLPACISPRGTTRSLSTHTIHRLPAGPINVPAQCRL